ncbi:hypothetical protein GCM10010259_22770 [Streptomyces daghestanicus]|uniref:Uncharacterized protein n=1 Tax=Streptomyces daghestanicus TaxID=66885 RepID=A0ABQ3Q6D7_9ACTN|nr:hypothetical protein GCM10010259_22770 [Streptomyces daghestanicus]GHI32857.1 hypothetical protein Sdagh_45870 [Streptomyces daghestanicus]
MAGSSCAGSLETGAVDRSSWSAQGPDMPGHRRTAETTGRWREESLGHPVRRVITCRSGEDEWTAARALPKEPPSRFVTTGDLRWQVPPMWSDVFQRSTAGESMSEAGRFSGSADGMSTGSPNSSRVSFRFRPRPRPAAPVPVPVPGP